MIVKNRIKYYREKYNITQEELGKKINKTKQYISKLENQNINVGIGLAIEIVKAIRELTNDKSFGIQTVKICVEDVFYISE